MDNFLKSALAIQIIAILAVLLNIPVLQQIIGFIYVFFLPGFLLLRVAKLNLQTIVEVLLLSIGLSISFSMLLGLALNELLPLVGVGRPMSVLPVLIVTSLALLLISYFGRNCSGWTCSLPEMNRKKIGQIAPSAIVIVTAIAGAFLTSSWILLVMVLAISILVILGIFGRKKLPVEFYPIAIIAVAVSLALQMELISQNIFGWDVFGEFYVFKLTSLNGLWNPSLAIPVPQLCDYNSMLSVTILPTVFSNLSSVQPEWIFKVVYFLIYAFVPLGIYEAYRRDFGKSIAFLSAFYFAFFPRFYTEERRQIVGELFLVLMIFTLLSRNLNNRGKQALLGVFGIALIVSHYSISYIAIVLIFFAWVVISLQKRSSIFHNAKLSGSRIERVLNARLLAFFGIFGIFWTLLVSRSLGNTFLTFIENLSTAFTSGFADLSSRGGTVSQFIAPSLQNLSLIYQIDTLINKIPYVLIIIGFLAVFLNRKKIKLQSEYIPMALGVFVLLLMALVIPFFANAFGPDRFFHVSLILLAPLCFYGGYEFLKLIQKRLLRINAVRFKAITFLTLFFTVIFLFKVGFVDQVSNQIGSDTSASISYQKILSSGDPQTLTSFYDPFVPQQDVTSALWLVSSIPQNATVFADYISFMHVLTAYANRTIDFNSVLSNDTSIKPGSYVYLRTLNVLGYTDNANGVALNMSYVQKQLNDATEIYSNGNSKIYFVP